jgi:membrane protein
LCTDINRTDIDRMTHQDHSKATMIDLLTETLKAWMKHRAASRGAALAFYTLFAIAPILLLAVAVAGYFFGARAAQGDIVTELQQLVGLNAATAIRSVLIHAHDASTGRLTTIVASVFLLIAATSVFSELKDSLDEIWGVPQPRYSGVVALIRTQLLSFALVFLLAALVVFSLLISRPRGTGEFRLRDVQPCCCLLRNRLLASGFWHHRCLFAVVYKMLPDAALSWSDVWIGAAVTAGFSASANMRSVVSGAKRIASTFGAAGSVIALLLWIYYSAQIFLLGAQFTRQYALRFGSRRPGAICGRGAAGQQRVSGARAGPSVRFALSRVISRAEIGPIGMELASTGANFWVLGWGFRAWRRALRLVPLHIDPAASLK